MKLALIGYGKMGRAVDDVAAARGIEVVERFTRDHPLRANGATSEALAGAILIDFSVADVVVESVRAASALGLDIVIGTTGWRDRIEDVRAAIDGSGIGVVYGSNFSVGVNVFYRIVDEAARLLASLDGYDPFILDWHHRFKKDSPSGTALELQHRMARYYGARAVPIASQRAGYVPSMHSVSFDSEIDTIHMEHRTRNRRGLAEGALLAANWIAGHDGLHEFGAVLDSVLGGATSQQSSYEPRNPALSTMSR
jgi:4-hydroxy-tetrahydrodipicolinate reductase